MYHVSQVPPKTESTSVADLPQGDGGQRERLENKRIRETYDTSFWFWFWFKRWFGKVLRATELFVESCCGVVFAHGANKDRSRKFREPIEKRSTDRTCCTYDLDF